MQHDLSKESTTSILKTVTNKKKKVTFNEVVNTHPATDAPQDGYEYCFVDNKLSQQKIDTYTAFMKEVNNIAGLSFMIHKNCFCQNAECSPTLIAMIDEDIDEHNFASLLRQTAHSLSEITNITISSIKNIITDEKSEASIKSFLIDYDNLENLPRFADELNKSIKTLAPLAPSEDENEAEENTRRSSLDFT